MSRSIIVVASLLAFAACAAGEESSEAVPEVPAVEEPSAPSAPPPEVPATEEPGPLTDETPLTAEGWGPLRVGMTLEEVTAAAGEDANPEAVGGAEPSMCDEFRPTGTPPGTLVMMEQERLSRISISEGSPLRTDAGFGVGDAASAIKAEYGDRAQTMPHKYVEAPAEYITVWSTGSGAPDSRGIVYEIGGDGRVMHVHVGGPSIQYVEGCL
jgi:hypothetical protein